MVKERNSDKLIMHDYLVEQSRTCQNLQIDIEAEAGQIFDWVQLPKYEAFTPVSDAGSRPRQITWCRRTSTLLANQGLLNKMQVGS